MWWLRRSLSRSCRTCQPSNYLLGSRRRPPCWKVATIRSVRLLSDKKAHDDPRREQGKGHDDDDDDDRRSDHDGAGDRADGSASSSDGKSSAAEQTPPSFSPSSPFFSTAWIPPPHSPVLRRPASRDDREEKGAGDSQDAKDIAPGSPAAGEAATRPARPRHPLWSPPSIIRVGGADGFDDDDVYDEPGAGHDRGGAGEDDGGGVSGGGEKDVDFGGYSIQDGPLLVTPSQGQLLRDRDEAEWLEVKVHVLLSRDEIAYCLRMLGLTEVVAILDCPERPRMGGGTAGMILATAQTLHQLRSAAEGLVRQLKRRRLHEVGVVGAELGPEGSFSSSGDARESWFVVDCQNYVVHLMDEPTRSALRLEDLWSGKDGLHRLDLLDESAVDEYVSRNPVPEEYSRRVLSYEAGGADDVLRQLEKIRWTVPLKPVTANQEKARGNRKGRKRRGSQ